MADKMTEVSEAGTGKSTDVIIDEWFVKFFHNQPSFSDNNVIWDRLVASRDALKKSLKEG